MAVAVEFFFDFVSPYSYLAWRRWPTVLPGVPRRPVPVAFGALLSHHGQLGPAEIPAKRAFTIRDTLRRAQEAGLPMAWPALHPFRSLLANRLALAEVSGSKQAELIDALFAAGWGQGRDLADPEVLAAILEDAGLEAKPLLARASEKSASEALRRHTDEAIRRGAFGVPTFFVSDELFFGDDQLERIARALEGRDVLDQSKAAETIARPIGLIRKAIKPSEAAVAVPTKAIVPGQQLQIFADAPFMQHLGVQVANIGSGEVETTLSSRRELTQQDGFLHAGVLAAIADHTAGAAAATLAAPGQRVLSVEFKINLLRSSRAPEVRCRAKVLRPGRTISVVESEVFDAGGASEKLVAKATVTLALVEPT